jgi:hypothetical protein
MRGYLDFPFGDLQEASWKPKFKRSPPREGYDTPSLGRLIFKGKN